MRHMNIVPKYVSFYLKCIVHAFLDKMKVTFSKQTSPTPRSATAKSSRDDICILKYEKNSPVS